MSDGTVHGGINLHGSTASAFDGRHDELAALDDGWAGGAVTNAGPGGRHPAGDPAAL